MSLLTQTITLIVVIDALGSIPIVLSLLSNESDKQFNRIMIRETAMATCILLIFYFLGSQILAGLGLSPAALQISGGLILFLIALRMVFPSSTMISSVPISNPLLVPIALPLVAGPASIALVMLMQSSVLPILIAGLVSCLIFLSARVSKKVLGNTILIAIERLMGLLLVTMAVQMILAGAKLFLAL